MTEEQLQKAWQALFDGQYQLAKQLVFQIDQDNYSTLYCFRRKRFCVSPSILKRLLCSSCV